MFTNPDRLLRFHATRRALFCRPTRFNLNHVTTILPTVVLENRDEITPTNFTLVPSVAIRFQHRLHVQILDEHAIVLVRIEVRDFVLVIALLVRHSSVNLSNAAALFLPVIRLVLLARERALLDDVVDAARVEQSRVANAYKTLNTELGLPTSLFDQANSSPVSRRNLTFQTPPGVEQWHSQSTIEKLLFQTGVVRVASRRPAFTKLHRNTEAHSHSRELRMLQGCQL